MLSKNLWRTTNHFLTGTVQRLHKMCCFITIMTSSAKHKNIKIYAIIISIVDQNRNKNQSQAQYRKKKLSRLQSLSSHLPWSVRAEHTGALAFDHGNFNQSFSHFIGNSLPPSPFKHCLGELSVAGSISGNYTCKVMLGAGLNISAKCICC